MTTTNETILEVEGLRTEFKTDGGNVVAVDGLSFSLKRGETLGIVGESGSGKSVTQLSIMGLIPSPPGKVTAGTAKLDGKDLLKMSDSQLRGVRGNKVAMIFQDPMTSLNPFLRISKQLDEVLETHTDMNAEQRRKRAIELFQQVGIPDAAARIDSYPHEFSGGMRQRVMIAMALLCNPELLIADEPTTALDVTIQAQILELMKELREKYNTGIILITHDLGVVAGTADRIMVMYAGKTMELATTQELFARPSHPYTIGLLRSIPRLDAEQREDLVPIHGMPPDLSNPPTGCPFEARCPFAIAECSQRVPELRDAGGGHMVRCIRDEVPSWHAQGLTSAPDQAATEGAA